MMKRDGDENDEMLVVELKVTHDMMFQERLRSKK